MPLGWTLDVFGTLGLRVGLMVMMWLLSLESVRWSRACERRDIVSRAGTGTERSRDLLKTEDHLLKLGQRGFDLLLKLHQDLHYPETIRGLVVSRQYR